MQGLGFRYKVWGCGESVITAADVGIQIELAREVLVGEAVRLIVEELRDGVLAF